MCSLQSLPFPSYFTRARNEFFTLFVPFNSLSHGTLKYGSKNTEFLLHLAADFYVMSVTEHVANCVPQECEKVLTVLFLLWKTSGGRLRLKSDGTHAETRFCLSAKRTCPFTSSGASVQSTNGSRGVLISGSNAG